MFKKVDFFLLFAHPTHHNHVQFHTKLINLPSGVINNIKRRKSFQRGRWYTTQHTQQQQYQQNHHVLCVCIENVSLVILQLKWKSLPILLAFVKWISTLNTSSITTLEEASTTLHREPILWANFWVVGRWRGWETIINGKQRKFKYTFNYSEHLQRWCKQRGNEKRKSSRKWLFSILSGEGSRKKLLGSLRVAKFWQKFVLFFFLVVPYWIPSADGISPL
jgi:hypothetical protein